MKTFLAFFTTCLLLITQPAFSIDLQTAKDQGLVGETPSGYLAAVKSPSPEVSALIESINSNTSLQAVEQLAGKKAIEKSAPGSYVKVGGSWQKK
jgi:uncharacterized protein YdbL (DUF1318 family)